MKRKKETKPKRDANKDHTRITIQLPEGLLDDLKTLTQTTGIDFKDDLIARMALSLALNDTLMAPDRLRRLIFCKQLSYEYNQQRRRKPRDE